MRRVLILLAISWILLTSGLSVYAQASECGQAGAPACISDIVTVIKNIISLLAPAAAVGFLLVIIYGGFQLVTSGGDPKAAAGARGTLTYAVIGAILVLVSWLILLLIQNITNTPQDITTVDLPTN